MSQFMNPAMKQLTDQQVRYAPRDVRLTQIDRAEEFISKLDIDETYRYPDLCEKITSYRPEMYPDMVLSGEEAIHDLRCFVEDVSGSASITADSIPEPVLTVQEVSARYNVSTKTVDRWRNRGLCSRRFMFGKRKRIGFLESTVERFVAKYATEISKSARFSQLSEDERRDIVRRARKLARSGGCPSDVSRRLARKLNRSPETIRYTLKNYDQEHPELAVFPHASSPLTEEKRRDIFNDFRRGIPVERLAKEHCRTKTSVYRIINEIRAERLLGQTINFMDSPEFDLVNAEEMILADPPEIDKSKSTTKAPPGLPPYLASLYSIPLLTREEEEYYFRKMNYLKCRAASLRDQLDPVRPKSAKMDEVEIFIESAIEVKNFLIRSNLRLVVSIAKKHMKPGGNFFEMVSDGNMSLIRAIEKFDYTQGNKFSTYASWAIMKNFARTIPKEYTRLDRFRTGKDEVFTQFAETRQNPFQEEIVNRTQHQAILEILDQLDERERDIICFRFGLDYEQEPLTLEQVGNHFGVTKERIRQIEARALKKLKKIALTEKLDIPGFDLSPNNQLEK